MSEKYEWTRELNVTMGQAKDMIEYLGKAPFTVEQAIEALVETSPATPVARKLRVPEEKIHEIGKFAAMGLIRAFLENGTLRKVTVQ